MNLSKRALLVIIPVILVSYCLAAFTVYYSLDKTITRLEQNRLNLAATELAASFNQYTIFAESYLLALVESNAFRSLLTEDDDVYRQVGLGSSIEKSIRSFKQHQSKKLSFLVVETEPTERELYYFELSNDPFASSSEQQQQAYRKVISTRIPNYWTLVEEADDGISIVISKLIDRTTFIAPVGKQNSNSLVVQLGLEPSQFLALKKSVEKNYNTKIQITKQNQAKTEKLFVNHPMSMGLNLIISVPQSYLDDKLAATKIILSLIAVAFFLVSSMLLYRLTRKYITGPISKLELELSEVMNRKKSNITIRHGNQDEIGRLEKTFHSLYGDLSNSYIKTKELAEHDPLTKLHNLAYVSEKTQEALTEAKRTGDHVALIYIDLDNFKFVNDKHGHEIGDALLKAFASRLTRVVRHADLVYGKERPDTTHGRIAGDEFSVIVRHFKDKKVPQKIAQRILAIFDNGFNFEKGQFPVSASIGIAIYPQDGHTLSQLVSNADNAMYQAKNSGKNNISFYSKELAMTMRRRVEIEQELKSINPDNEFYLVYMPLVSATSNQIEGFEVLLRWDSHKLGFVGPDEFVPIAEASGLFTKIDSWVTENAIKAYHSLKDRLGRDFKLSINLSSAQLNMDLIGDHLRNLVTKYQIAPQNIQLEMTETLNVEYTKQASALLNVLCASGFQIAIDDFGTGYTALLQLIEYPAQMIKFDKTFVDKAMQPDNRSMLEPLVSLCQSQGLQVTVEGVETAEMASYLKSIGCDYLQGYHYGKPAKIEDLELSIPPSQPLKNIGASGG